MVVGVLCHLDQPVSGSASGGTSHPCPGPRLPTELFLEFWWVSHSSHDCRLKGAWLGTSELLVLLVCGVLRTPSWLKGEAGHLAVSGMRISWALHPDAQSGRLPTVTVL